MSSTSQFKDLNSFLAKHSAKNEKNEHKDSGISHTHTRIGDQSLNIYGGSYIIPKEEQQAFMNLYYQQVFVQKKMEYLTECQLKADASASAPTGGIFIDVDLRYSFDIEGRQHSKEHILDLINLLYLEELKEFFIFEPNVTFPIYVFEKPDVNRLADGSLTKDGVHIIIGIQMNHTLQIMLRDRIIGKIGDVWELPITNTWDAVFDEGISKGTTNWQMYGSRKPANQAYEMTQYYLVSFDSRDSEFMLEEKKIGDIDLSKDLIKLSAQYDQHIKFEMNPKIKDEYEDRAKNGVKKLKKINSKSKVKLLCSDEDDTDNNIQLEDIDNFEKLKTATDKIMSTFTFNEYYIKEAHEYVQILPAKYYDPGSHALNRMVAFALKHTDERLFLSWVMLRSKASDFDYSTIPNLYHQWIRYFKDKPNGVTIRSIMYWAKQDAFDDYERVKKTTRDYYIEETLSTPTEFDFAIVLFQMCKEKYVCSSLVNKTWYVFKDHRWELDRGESLRMFISIDMYNAYQAKVNSWMNEMQHYDPTDERYVSMSKRVKTGTGISTMLKRTNDKNNIMREAAALFFDKDFDKNMDSNKWLMCFKNGVIDIKNRIFRDGMPLDYITKTTNINYEAYDVEKHGLIADQIQTFMEQLFPIKSLNNYMWEHLASVLIGENINQTFNIYRGSGSNGKSIFTDLMSYTLGEYYGEVPVTLVTEKRPGIGGTSSEIVQLKGVRFAVMQEPSKDARINEGMMKQLTGDSTLSGRALYHEQETFLIQFHLVLCTNTLFEVMSNDDGTWRRIRICDFLSKFVEPGETFQTSDTPYQFPKDKSLKEKLRGWANVLASMLVKLAFENQGIVSECDIVKASSNKYRQGQDHISAFVAEKVGKRAGEKVMKTDLYEQFKLWFQEQQGSRKMPKGVELFEYMNNKFGEVKKGGGWKDIEILYDKENETDEVGDL
jgi:P4 family phage/plasmid primase-like protien